MFPTPYPPSLVVTSAFCADAVVANVANHMKRWRYPPVRRCCGIIILSWEGEKKRREFRENPKENKSRKRNDTCTFLDLSRRPPTGQPIGIYHEYTSVGSRQEKTKEKKPVFHVVLVVVLEMTKGKGRAAPAKEPQLHSNALPLESLLISGPFL